MTNNNMNYPEKEIYLGSYVIIANNKYNEAKHKLQSLYNQYKSKYEKSGEKIWCKFDEPEFIHSKPNNIIDLLSGINETLGIKWRISGRAFYILRNFKPNNDFNFV